MSIVFWKLSGLWYSLAYRFAFTIMMDIARRLAIERHYLKQEIRKLEHYRDTQATGKTQA